MVFVEGGFLVFGYLVVEQLRLYRRGIMVVIGAYVRNRIPDNFTRGRSTNRAATP